MIVLVCGPSGSGKTTFLANVAASPQCDIVTLWVSRQRPRQLEETGKREVDPGQFALADSFQFRYAYDDSCYGFSLSDRLISSSAYAFLDYPGEYPTCPELKGIVFQGLLILPPGRSVLVRRLVDQGKEHRVASALAEYKDCLQELRRGLYDAPQWRVYISRDQGSLEKLVADVVAGQLFRRPRNTP